MAAKQTTTDRVYEALKAAILAGEYPPRTHLTAEGIARRLKVSRTPVREGLRRLHAEGLVDLVANQGAFVVSLSMAEMSEIYTLRAMLEGRAAELAAHRLTDAQLDELARLADRMESFAAGNDPDQLSAVGAANDRFHMLIAEAAGSPRLTLILSTLLEVPVALRTFSRYTPEEFRRSMQHHRDLIAAFAARDAEWARVTMECHINSARSIYTRAVRDLLESHEPG